MHKKNHFQSFLITTICCFSFTVLQAQQDTTSSDGLLQAARQAAFKEDNYPKAINYCKQALIISPSYTDIRVFLGRLYSWSNKYDSAKICFEQAIQESPNDEDAYMAYIDLQYWNDYLKEGLTLCNKALTQQIMSIGIQLRKAKILNALKQYEPAATVVDTILQQDKNNTEARALAARIKDNRSINKVSISYDYTTFDNQFPDPWHITSLDYTRRTGIGSVTGRINYANRFKDNGVQYEIDAYPSISRIFYSYVSIGYSNDVGVFPQYRGGFSLYANLPASFEAELGFRYLKFTSDPTWIYTGYVGKYYRSFLFGLRTYLTPSTTINSVSHSYALSTRYYYNGSDDFLNITIGSGISPDDRVNNFQLDSAASVPKLASYRANMQWRYTIHRFHTINANIGWINQEYFQGTTKFQGNQYEFGVGYQYRF